MIQFNKCALKNSILDQWIQTNVNVLLIGEKGVGKTAQIRDAFERNKVKYAYFTGATLDPWIHLLGIPKAVHDPETGQDKMKFVLPENLDENVEAIYCDEWNRTNSIVRNALLELQQFKSINGRKFPKLRMVWGSINPPKNKELDNDDPEYDVEELDPAQLDRFHVIVELPNEPNVQYFSSKFGKYKGEILCKWWKEQPKEAHKILSPRRLEYVGEMYEKGLDVKYMLPMSANTQDLISKLGVDEESAKVKQALEQPTDKNMKELFSNNSITLRWMELLKKEKYWKYWKYADKELISQRIHNDEIFQNYAIHESLKGNTLYKEIISEIQQSSSTEIVGKILTVLSSSGIVAKPKESLADFIIDDDNPLEIDPTTPLVSTKNNGKSTLFCESPDIPSRFRSAHTSYAPSELKMNTNYRLSLLTNLHSNFYANAVKNAHLVINFVMSCVMSLQKDTINRSEDRAKNINELVGSTIVLAKNTLTPEQYIRLQKHLEKAKDKLYANKFDCFLPKNEYIPLDSNFIKKVTEIRRALEKQQFNECRGTTIVC